MSNIKKAFENGKAFIGFVTAGDPTMDKTESFILKMAEAGSDLIEIGIPFSDPIAEGEIIERANERALSVGATTDKVFEMVKNVRKKSQVPLVFLSYMNPIFVYGIERFFASCKECSIDGIIVPDLPYEEKDEIADIAKQNGVDVITLIAPTSKDRIKMLAKDSSGFIYILSSMGDSGVQNEVLTEVQNIVEEIRTVSDIPVAVGVSTEEQSKAISSIVDGVIVGNEIVHIIETHGEKADEFLVDYVSKMKASLKN